MDNYPSNSHKAAEAEETQTEDKKINSVVQGEVTRRKKPLSKRLTETFVGGDARSVWSYVVMEVLVPAAKDMASDAISQGFERMIYGETRSNSRRPSQRGGGGTYVSYNKMGGSARRSGLDEFRRPDPRTKKDTHDFDEIILATRAEGEEVIDQLFELISKYEVATVSDLNDLIGVSSNYVDQKWGWTELPGAGVTRIRGGFLLDLPKPEPIR